MVIDAREYSPHTAQTRCDVHMLYSGNLIFICAKRKGTEFGGRPHTVSGVLLATDEAVQPDNCYQI